jgi:xanthine permease XanP
VGPSLEAVRIGGLALMSGMTLFGGVLETAVSKSLNRLRSILPPELAGVVIFLVGISTAWWGCVICCSPTVWPRPGCGTRR